MSTSWPASTRSFSKALRPDVKGECGMNDQEILENLLLTTKGACDLYLHGTIESATQNLSLIHI